VRRPLGGDAGVRRPNAYDAVVAARRERRGGSADAVAAAARRRLTLLPGSGEGERRQRRERCDPVVEARLGARRRREDRRYIFDREDRLGGEAASGEERRERRPQQLPADEEVEGARRVEREEVVDNLGETVARERRGDGLREGD
jgi:hypothetical protein